MKGYVVDDQRAIVEMLTLLLSDLGVEVRGTTDPTQAQDDISAWQPDLILLDIMMPRLDGLALLDRLQHDPHTEAIPVVLCTASVLSPSQGRLFADQGIGVLSKPFDLEQLQSIVASIRTRART